MLSVAIASTGIVTYAFFALASHALPPNAYGRITLLWSAVFITVSVLYRPIEQLLSRTIADRDARGQRGGEHMRIAATIQLALGVAFVAVALALRGPLEHRLFSGSGTLYWVLVVAVVAYAASYFARGFLAGHRLFGYYGGLLLLESAARFSFALVVVLGVASGESAVALGVAVAPIVSLLVIPFVVARRLLPRGVGRPSSPAAAEPAPRPAEQAAGERAPGAGTSAAAEFSLGHGSRFAASVVIVMLAEQTFLNAGPLIIRATQAGGGVALAGLAFNVLVIARAPLQLFQAVQTSILPHLTRLRVSGSAEGFSRSVTLTIRAVAVFAAAVALAMLVAGPELMHLAFGGDVHYGRAGLVTIALGMGLYLAAATLNQAALSRVRAGRAAACWAAAAAVFVLFLIVPAFGDRLLQVESGFAVGAALLCALLYRLYRLG